MCGPRRRQATLGPWLNRRQRDISAVVPVDLRGPHRASVRGGKTGDIGGGLYRCARTVTRWPHVHFSAMDAWGRGSTVKQLRDNTPQDTATPEAVLPCTVRLCTWVPRSERAGQHGGPRQHLRHIHQRQRLPLRALRPVGNAPEKSPPHAPTPPSTASAYKHSPVLDPQLLLAVQH